MVMQTILHNACLIIICLTVDITESVPADERSPSSFQSTSKNCTTPKPVVDGAILKWQAGRDNSVFLPGEKAEFVCKEGYRQIGWLKTLTCQKDGSWSSQTSIDDDFKPSESVSGKLRSNVLFMQRYIILMLSCCVCDRSVFDISGIKCVIFSVFKSLQGP